MFSELKIVELAGVLAGPAVGMFFAELGAEVVKIENPATGGDMTRHWKTEGEESSGTASAYFASVNWGKEYLFLNLKDEADRSLAYELIRDADVVICNWKRGDAEKLKMNEAVLRELNRELIYAQLTGFGEDDDRIAYDVVLQAETGWMYMNGDISGSPVKIPVAIVDLFAAHQLKEGILTAYIQKLKTGKGSRVSVSLFDAAVASLANQAANFLVTGNIPQRLGSLHPNIAPYGELLQFADGKEIVLAVGTDKQFTALCNILDRVELCTNEKFSTNRSRVIHRKELIEYLRRSSVEISSDDFIAACRSHHVPVGSVRNLKELFDDPMAQRLVLSDAIGRRVKTKVFEIEMR